MIMKDMPDVFTKFESEEQKLNILKETEVISAKAKTVKDFVYSGCYVQKSVPCEVVGFKRYRNSEGAEYIELVLYVTGKYHSINPDYFKELQKTDNSQIETVEQVAMTLETVTVSSVEKSQKEAPKQVVFEQLSMF